MTPGLCMETTTEEKTTTLAETITVAETTTVPVTIPTMVTMRYLSPRKPTVNLICMVTISLLISYRPHT